MGDNRFKLETDEDALEGQRASVSLLSLQELDVSKRELYYENRHWAYFERLRREDPVHYHKESLSGPFWSITRFADIKAVDENQRLFSSKLNVTINDQPEDFQLPMFIAMDQPQHDFHRQTVAPIVAPTNLAKLEDTIRDYSIKILEDIPIEQTFNWVDRVSVELTAQMLATLFDVPLNDRYRLKRWSDVASNGPGSGIVESNEQKRKELTDCLDYFSDLFDERKDRPPQFDLISMLAHGEATKNSPSNEFLGNILLLIVGGNDTTRNSISGSVLGLNQYPSEYKKLLNDRALIPNMVSEIIRWQTPVPHMRRTAISDTEIGGKTIRAGDKVVIWYISGNRDELVFQEPHALRIDRANARQHVAFGYGIHRCMGNRLAEMQLRVLWEEILKRFKHIEVVGDPVRTKSNLIRGYLNLPVVVHPL
tara:strand:- start:6206 stop:7474 length:1269 start_codon:yes stop_codon:yes gene_type:complete